MAGEGANFSGFFLPFLPLDRRRNLFRLLCMSNSQILKPKKILLFGATGLVGRTLLKKMNSQPQGELVHVLARRSLPLDLKNKNVLEFKMNFDFLDESSDCFKVDTVICAIGTTIKIAGSQENFRQVDYSYPLQIAKIARRNGAQNFFLVSALAANQNSLIFYNRVKGQLETALQQMGFESLVIVRPSVLIGEREHARPLESISQQLGRLLPLKWKSVPADNIAQKFISLLKSPPAGVHIIENQDLF